jgi:CDP-paratose 2-epimerase
VFHFAAQVAVTSSLIDPLTDFSVNAAGTLNVLEALRRMPQRIPLIYSSTNKVYGGLDDLEMVELDDRYIPANGNIRLHGINEDRPLDFHTPYGCSKGVADQYVLDYARSFNIPTAVLRMSCIYGPRQFGTEDQGWVAHFALQALRDAPITIYGNGKQIRDVLHVRDAVSAYRGILNQIDAVQGRAFNLGGGPENAISLLAVLNEIKTIIGRNVPVRYAEWRTGDQCYFVSDTRRLCGVIDWSAKIGWKSGLVDLIGWLETLCTETPAYRSAVA